MFKYKKDAKKEPYYYNGRFRFFLDYEEKIYEVNEVTNFKTGNYYIIAFILQIIATFFLKPGYHEFLWQYSKYLEPSEADEINNLKLTIESIEIEGVDYADYECNNCTGKKSSAGSSECFYCKVNSYFDQRTETCVTCPIGTFSFSNAMSVNDCLESQPCSINDYDYTLTDCIDGKQTRKFYYTDPKFCDYQNFKLPVDEKIDCEACKAGQYLAKIPSVIGGTVCKSCETGAYSTLDTLKTSSDKCITCENGKYITKQFLANNNFNSTDYNFINSCYSKKTEDCLHINGFSFQYDSMISVWFYIFL